MHMLFNRLFPDTHLNTRTSFESVNRVADSVRQPQDVVATVTTPEQIEQQSDTFVFFIKLLYAQEEEPIK